MTRSPRTRFILALPLALAVATAAAARPAASPALFGPPWISIESPPSPYDRTTRDAYLLVHAYHHGTPANLPVSGTAEGLVDGRRRSVTLAFTPTSRPGVYALRKQWPDDGAWALVLTVEQEPGDGASALVRIGGGGEVASVTVPTERRAGWEVAAPRQITAAEIDAALHGRMASR